MALGITMVSATSSAAASVGQPAQLAQKGGGGWLRVRLCTMTGDAAQPALGYAVTASTFLLPTQILGIDFIATSGLVTYTAMYDYTHQTIVIASWANPPAIVSNTAGWNAQALVFGF